jgi:hypothetical protein
MNGKSKFPSIPEPIKYFALALLSFLIVGLGLSAVLRVVLPLFLK